MTSCPPICGRKKKKEKNKEVKKIEKEKTVEELVPRRFWKWKKVNFVASGDNTIHSITTSLTNDT